MRIVPYALLRAPLLPVAALDDPSIASPLFDEAVALASPTLHGHADPRGADRVARYRRRAAFRPTPHGLLAGVAVVPLDDRPSSLSLGVPRAHHDVTWSRLAALGRELLGGPAWKRAKLRLAPSLVVSAGEVCWLAFGDREAVQRVLTLDDTLALLLDCARSWTLTSRLERQLGLPHARELLLQLVDDGFLHHDLEPPLVGPPPTEWMKRRVPGLELTGTPATIRAELALLPGHGPTPLHATLLHSAGRSHVDLEPIARAAALAPLLFAMADALAPPIDESRLAGLDEQLAAARALVGEGLVPVPALEHERYGTRHVEPPAPGLDVVCWLAGLVVAAAPGRDTLELDAAELERRCGVAATDSFELQLAPCRGGREGEDWLLGIHAPAGSSWGRYAHALGEEMHEALAALRQAELEVDGDVLRLDVAYAPSHDVAELCCTPALRDAALAVSSWPEGGAVTPQQCQVVNEPGSVVHRAIAVDGQRLRIAPLHRVRSTTAPRSATRALLGDSLRRQHAPWALTWGPLAQLPWLPRVRLDGFVIAPQSWALPMKRDDASLAAWRVREGIGSHVQVGSEDVLLPIDLDDPAQRVQLRDPALLRAHEIWPPLGRELDGSGRRCELVCAVLDEAVASLPPLGVASPPAEAPAESSWRTLVIFASRRHHDLLLPAIVDFATRRAMAWFVLPYVDDDGEQLRVRMQGKTPDVLVVALLRVLTPFVAQGLVVTTQVRPYHPEHARYGAALPAVEQIFQADSRLLVEPYTLPAEAHVALVLEAMARGLGLPAPDLDVVSSTSDTEAAAYRAVQRELGTLMDVPPAWSTEHTKRVRAAGLRKADARRLLPTLLHMTAVRHLGPDREAELRALHLWSRARRSRAARQR